VARSPEIFLQGSYANATNIYGDSDVDVVVLYKDTFHKDLSALPLSQQQQHARDFATADYQWSHLRDDVLTALRAHYGGAAVVPGRKSIKVTTAHGQRPADVIPAVEFRRYETYVNPQALTAHWGIQLFDSAGTAIVNYPKYHIERGESKNSYERTGGRYKATVRVFKNLRNYMCESGLIPAGLAPSYFLECALHNVPDQLFRGDLTDTVPAIMNWLLQAPTAGLRCQNGVTGLCGAEPTQWPSANAEAFALAARAAWDTW